MVVDFVEEVVWGSILSKGWIRVKNLCRVQLTKISRIWKQNRNLGLDGLRPLWRYLVPNDLKRLPMRNLDLDGPMRLLRGNLGPDSLKRLPWGFFGLDGYITQFWESSQFSKFWFYLILNVAMPSGQSIFAEQFLVEPSKSTFQLDK